MKAGRFSDEDKEMIFTLREQGISYNSIAERLNRSKDSIGSYCRTNNLDGNKSANGIGHGGEDVFISKFTDKHGHAFEYVSGYVSESSSFKLRCKKCDGVIEKNAQIVRRNKKVRCDSCSIIKAEALVKERAIKLEMKTARSAEKKRLLMKRREERHEGICAHCGESFNSSRRGKRYCSQSCSSRNSWKRAEIQRRKKLKENGEIHWDITLDKLIKRDGNMCSICGCLCNKEDYFIDGQGYYIAGNEYPSIDHVIPVNKGGTHTWDNVKLAHRHCNAIKSDSDVGENMGQLSLSL